MPAGLFGQKHFVLDKQRAFIEGHGEQVLILPVLQCPCLQADHQFSPICPTCKGTGRFYPPDTGYSTKMLLVSERSRRTYEEVGSWTPGVIQATILPGQLLAERDKVRRLDIREVFTDEVLTRGVDDAVRFTAGVEILLVADRERVYRAGIDYQLTAPNTLTWVAGGQAPAFMAQYSVKYAAQPEYLVTPDNPRSRVEHRIPQAQVVTMQRLDYVVEGGF